MDALEQRGQVVGGVGGLRDGVGRRLHRLGVLAPGDVARDGDAQLVVFGPARRPHDVDDLAVLAHVAVLEMKLGIAGHDAAGRLQGQFPVIRVHQFDHRPAEHFFGRVAEDALEGGADVNIAAFPVYHADGVEQEVDVVTQLGVVF